MREVTSELTFGDSCPALIQVMHTFRLWVSSSGPGQSAESADQLVAFEDLDII